MEVRFHIGNADSISQGAYDLVLSQCRSLQDVTSSVSKALLAERTELFLELKPPVAPGLSIPNAFQTILGMLRSRPNENLTVHVHVASDVVVEYLQEHCPLEPGTEKSWEYNGIIIIARMGNIVFANVDAIVNASNTLLKLGAGVSGAIAHARSLADGDAVITDSYGLPCRYIIHAVTACGGADTVQTALRNVFRICNEEKLSSIAIPALGTGTGGLSITTFAQVSVEEIKRISKLFPCVLKHVEFVMWTESDMKALDAVFNDSLSADVNT